MNNQYIPEATLHHSMNALHAKKLLLGLCALLFTFLVNAQEFTKESKEFIYPFKDQYSGVLKKHIKTLPESIRVVGLGEVSHYTKECYQLKEQIVLELIAKGFEGLVLEVDFGQALLWNDYVTKGIGNLDLLVSQSGWFTYRTEEFKSLLAAIRAHNINAAQPFQVYGMEMTAMNHNLEWLANYFSRTLSNQHPIIKRLKKERTFVAFQYHNPNEVLEYWDLFLDLRTLLEANEEKFKYKAGEKEYQTALHIAEITRQYATFISHDDFGLKVEFRDQFSTRNVLWSMNQLGEESRVAIWAHNGHVVKKSVIFNYDILGYYLNEIFGENYYAIGFTFNKGEFGAFSPNGFKRWELRGLRTPSWTKDFSKFKSPYLLFDVRSNLKVKNPPASSPLFTDIPIRRDIAESYREDNDATMDINLAQSYDCLIYFEESNYPTTITWAR